MYPARRAIAGPPITFSLTAAAVKPSGAQMGTGSSPITPATPPKWSMWLWVWSTAVTGRSPAMEAVLVHRDVNGTRVESLFETDLPYLAGAAPRPVFSL